MPALYHIANTLVLPPAMFFAWNFYKFRKSDIDFGKFRISIFLICLTATTTTLQFIFPVIISALDRNKDALLSGQAWRLITPLFIQPGGLWQCFFNSLFFIMFLPLAEYLYGRWVVLIYFGAGLLGQIVLFCWGTGLRGGSSTALYGLMGALFMYIILNRPAFPRLYILIPVAGFTGAVLLCFFKDGHAPPLLFAGVLALALHRYARVIPGNKEFYKAAVHNKAHTL